MRKYFIFVCLAISIGFYIGKTVLEQYDGYRGIKKVSSTGEVVYFIKYGEYKSQNEMEKETINLQDYIYNENNGTYYVYIGITNNQDNLLKLINYYSSLGFITSTEEYLITNDAFLNELKNYDNILSDTNDYIAIASIANQVLTKYEEIVNVSED